jgi:hypothetical protein
MKLQSNVEFIILLAVVVMSVVVLTFFITKNYTANINSDKNITINNVNILNFDLYYSSLKNTISGSFYQNGYKKFSNGLLKIELNNTIYSIPVSFNYYNSTITNYRVDFISNSLSGNVLNAITVGEPYTLIYIIFYNSSKSYIYYDNYSSIVYSSE